MATHQVELIRRIAREQGWRACCRSWVTMRVVGDLRGPIVRHPDTGRPLCPRCQRRAVAERINSDEAGGRLAA